MFLFFFKGRKPPSSTTAVRLVLLGKTGSGKSATANSILGNKVFDIKASSSSVTRYCRRACGEFRGRHLTLLETPGLLNTHQTPQEVLKEMRRSVSLLSPGPHAFLIVIQIGRFTREEKEAVRQIKQAMGSHALSFSVVVFTHGDLLEDITSVKHCLIDECKDLAELVAECGDRYCVFNNQTSKNNKEQVTELLALVDSMMEDNDGSYYNSMMLHKAEDSLVQQVQEERRLLNEKEELVKKEQEAAIKDWYEKELELFQQKCKKEMEERILKLKKQHEEKLARDREEAFRREVEENERKEKQRKIQEMVKMMETRKEEEEKREVIQTKLNKVIKMLDEQTEHAEKMRREIEEKMQKDSVENEKRERERELQQIEKEQAIRQREEMKTELDKLAHSLEENQRERETQMENLRAEKKITEALMQELKVTTMRTEEHKASEENLKRQLEGYLRRERDICGLKQQNDNSCSEMCNVPSKKSAESPVTTVVGYAQEMGLMGLNTALETVGSPCSIQ